MRNWQGDGPGSVEACWCGQPPAVEYTPTNGEAVGGWLVGPRDFGKARRFKPVFRCGRHQQNPPKGYTARFNTRQTASERTT